MADRQRHNGPKGGLRYASDDTDAHLQMASGERKCVNRFNECCWLGAAGVISASLAKTAGRVLKGASSESVARLAQASPNQIHASHGKQLGGTWNTSITVVRWITISHKRVNNLDASIG